MRHFRAMTSFVNGKMHALRRGARCVAVVEIVRYKHDAGGGRVHEGVRDVATMRDVMGPKIEPDGSAERLSDQYM